jgi:hypothetical protein
MDKIINKIIYLRKNEIDIVNFYYDKKKYKLKIYDLLEKYDQPIFIMHRQLISSDNEDDLLDISGNTYVISHCILECKIMSSTSW